MSIFLGKCRVGFCRAILLVIVVGSVGWVGVDVGVGWSLVGLRIGRGKGSALLLVCFNLCNCLLLGVSTISVQISNFLLLGC